MRSRTKDTIAQDQSQEVQDQGQDQSQDQSRGQSQGRRRDHDILRIHESTEIREEVKRELGNPHRGHRPRLTGSVHDQYCDVHQSRLIKK